MAEPEVVLEPALELRAARDAELELDFRLECDLDLELECEPAPEPELDSEFGAGLEPGHRRGVDPVQSEHETDLAVFDPELRGVECVPRGPSRGSFCLLPPRYAVGALAQLRVEHPVLLAEGPAELAGRMELLYRPLLGLLEGGNGLVLP